MSSYSVGARMNVPQGAAATLRFVHVGKDTIRSPSRLRPPRRPAAAQLWWRRGSVLAERGESLALASQGGDSTCHPNHRIVGLVVAYAVSSAVSSVLVATSQSSSGRDASAIPTEPSTRSSTWGATIVCGTTYALPSRVRPAPIRSSSSRLSWSQRTSTTSRPRAAASWL